MKHSRYDICFTTYKIIYGDLPVFQTKNVLELFTFDNNSLHKV